MIRRSCPECGAWADEPCPPGCPSQTGLRPGRPGDRCVDCGCELPVFLYVDGPTRAVCIGCAAHLWLQSTSSEGVE